MRGSATEKDIARFWAKVRKTDGCWLWTAGTFARRYGYGQFGLNGHPHKAHRLAWEFTNGPIPEGLSVLHHCDNPPCVNPAHLFLGTRGDNTRDMMMKGRSRSIADRNRGKTHCKHGHEFTPENTYPQPTGRGCRECRRLSHQRYEARRRAA